MDPGSWRVGGDIWALRPQWIQLTPWWVQRVLWWPSPTGVGSWRRLRPKGCRVLLTGLGRGQREGSCGWSAGSLYAGAARPHPLLPRQGEVSQQRQQELEMMCEQLQRQIGEMEVKAARPAVPAPAVCPLEPAGVFVSGPLPTLPCGFLPRISTEVSRATWVALSMSLTTGPTAEPLPWPLQPGSTHVRSRLSPSPLEPPAVLLVLGPNTSAGSQLRTGPVDVPSA